MVSFVKFSIIESYELCERVYKVYELGRNKSNDMRYISCIFVLSLFDILVQEPEVSVLN